MSWYYQSGEGLNLLARSNAVNVPTTDATFDANFPAANLVDGRPSAYAKLSALAAYRTIAFDLNLLPAGDGETDPVAAGWVEAVGNITTGADPTYGSGGTNSLRVYNATAPTAYRDVRMRAGEAFRVYYAAWGATGTATVRVTNQATGLDLTTAPAWGSGTLVSTAVAAWSSGYVTHVMPTAEEGGGLWQALRVTLAVSGAVGNGYFEVKIVPGWDTIALFGHTFSPLVPMGFEYRSLSANDPGDAWGSAANIADWLKTPQTVASPIPADEWDAGAVWNKAVSMRFERWVRFYLTRATYNATCAIGELILCQAETLPRTPRLQVSDAYEGTGQIRQESGAGDPWIYNRTPVPRQKITMRYQTADSPTMPGPSADERAIRRMFSGRTHGGLWPVLVIPYGSHDSRAVVYGVTQSVFGSEHMPPERALEVEVLAYPIPGLNPGLSA